MKAKTVVAIVGLPTSGKSTLGRALAKETGFHLIDIDEGPASCAPPRQEDPYDSDEGRAFDRVRMTVAYTVLHAAVEANLAQGFSVIIIATYSRHSNQDFLAEAAARGGGTLKVIRCQYHDSPEEIERRVQDRLARNAIGGCRSVAHYLDDKARYATVKLPHLVVWMEGGEEGTQKALQQALAYINDGES